MAKFSFLHALTIALIFSGMVLASEARELDVQKCIETLYPSKCTEADCKQKCLSAHNDERSYCLKNLGGTDASCVCIWNCGLNRLN
ncbi:hypothetical protein LINGRAHAP2_LOCUS35926 [Linum grandiflorum]